MEGLLFKALKLSLGFAFATLIFTGLSVLLSFKNSYLIIVLGIYLMYFGKRY